MSKTQGSIKRPALPVLTTVIGLLAVLAGCDHGFVPPDEPATGTIQASVTYVGMWPPQAQVHDLRFVAMRFVPKDTADFLQLTRMAISGRLEYGVDSDVILLQNVETGAFFYSGIAQQFDSDLLAWKPLGLYEENDGVFWVTADHTTEISLTIDFAFPPPFPPPDN